MKTLLKSVFVTTAAFVLLPLAGLYAQSKPGWTEDQAQALAKAKSEKKLVLMDFTGSDWCGWCIKMDKEVFDTPEFKSYAQSHLVLVELDFPHKKVLSVQTKQQNDALQKQYNVEGFPTLVVLDGEGKLLKTFGGYQKGGAQAFIEELKKLQG